MRNLLLLRPRNRRVAMIPPPPTKGEADSSTKAEKDEGEDAGTECGPECRNRLHELDHPREEERCAAGQVLDIWGYCRYLHCYPQGMKLFLTCHNPNRTFNGYFARQEHFP